MCPASNTLPGRIAFIETKPGRMEPAESPAVICCLLRQEQYLHFWVVWQAQSGSADVTRYVSVCVVPDFSVWSPDLSCDKSGWLSCSLHRG